MGGTPRTPVTIHVIGEYPLLAEEIVGLLRARGLLDSDRHRDRNTLLRAVKEICDEEDREQRLRMIAERSQKCIERRIALGYPAALAQSEVAFRTSLEPLVERVRTFYGPPEFDAGKSQLEVVFVFPRIDHETQLRLVARAIRTTSADPARLRAIGTEDGVRTLAVAELDIVKDFDALYAERVVGMRRPADTYALYGVHGGKLTHGYLVCEELEYFARKRRLGLTLVEALGLLAEHPQFLVQEGRLVMLGETYPGDRYACLSYDGAKLSLRLVTAKGVESEAPQRGDVGFGTYRSRYAKPSAAGWISTFA